MNVLERIVRYSKISKRTLSFNNKHSPPILIFYINSICNLRCQHCVYWKNLNRRDDLTVDEIISFARNLGRLEILALSGGEPFLRDRFSEICRFFIQHNKVEQIYVPTNATHSERTVKAVSEVLEEPDLKLFVVEISLDGMPEFHNTFRGSKDAFQRAMKTYDGLVTLQKNDPRLRIHAVSTATEKNIDEIAKLTTFLYSRCAAMEHHNIALIRGDRKNASLNGPDLLAYEKLHTYTRRLWVPREQRRYGSIVEPMLQWAKVQTLREKRQVVPCCAGLLNAVIYANGDVGICESHPPIGNIREKSFKEIWHSSQAKNLRRSIRNRQCFCSNEVFMWPSIVFQPLSLANAMLHAKVWKKPEHLREDELCM
jgi:MoaA/NifB/PqqE/SkfB family radical SAM enzyme